MGPIIAHVILAVVTWIFCAIAFERGLETVSRRQNRLLPKAELAKLYWLILAVILMVTSGNLIALLILAPIAASHLDLVAHTPGPVSITSLIHNVGNVTRRFVQRVSP